MRNLLIVAFAINAFFSLAQDSSSVKKRKLTWYGTWGYNRECYTRSTIHFKNAGEPGYTDPVHGPYDFEVVNVKAHDSPDFNHIASSWNDVVNITIPQFNVRVGVYFNNEKDEGFEIAYDHAKYVVTDGQGMHFQGNILGRTVNTPDSMPTSQQFHFEHTDGANFWTANYIKRWKLWKSPNLKNNVGFIVKPGAGVVIPRTDCTIFGSRLNNQWHIAGFIAAVETGFRVQLFNHLCIELTGKASYADYLWCYVQYRGNGNANHRFGCLGAILNVGYQFHTKKPFCGKKDLAH